MNSQFKKFVKVAFLVSALSFGNICLSQSTGQIKGTVIDKKTKALLSYATVVIKKYGIVRGSTLSDENGNYLIKSVDSGYYDLEVIYIEYKKSIITNVSIDSGCITTLNFELELSDTKFIIDCEWRIQCIPMIPDDRIIKSIRFKEIIDLPTGD